MSRTAERFALLCSDALMLCAAFWAYYAARFTWTWLGPPESQMQETWLAMTFLTGFWLLFFVFSGLYRERYAESRLDELVSLFKAVTVGMLILFFVLFIDTFDAEARRSNIALYWGLVYGCVAFGRLVVRSVQKGLLLRGYGRHRALIVGWSDEVETLYDEVNRYPAAGLDVVGLVRMRHARAEPVPVLADGGDGASVVPVPLDATAYDVEELPRLIDDLDVQDVVIALGSDDHDALFQVLRLCDGKPVTLKLVPDFYSVIGGMARTEHMYGLPLIEVLPMPMPPWEQSVKRLLDVAVSAAVLLVGLPVWLVLGILVALTSPGPAIYRQRRVGQHGREFTMLKFRTMWADAEAHTGPVWASADDPRYTPLGRWLRKLRLDEVPQFWNVLRGDMSLVGPRPERPFFVDKLAEDIPLYRRRHRVKPGITGLAQVKWKYDQSLDDVRQKTKYDLFYIENMSLQIDLKILIQTLRTTLSGKGH